MSILYMCSFGAFNSVEDLAEAGWIVEGPAPQFFASGGRQDGPYMRLLSGTSLIIPLPVELANRDVWFGFGLRWQTMGQYPLNVALIDNATSRTPSVLLEADQYANVLRFRDGPGNIAAATGRPPHNTWTFFEMRANIVASGTGEMWVDDQAVGSGATSFLPSFPQWYPRMLRITINDGTFDFGDLYFLDTSGTSGNKRVGASCKVRPMLPTANGAHADFVPVGVAENWDAVDGVADADATHVRATAPGLDTYVCSDPGLVGGHVLGVQVSAIARAEPIGTATVRTVIRSNGMDHDVTGDLVLSGPTGNAYKARTAVCETNPATGAAWTLAQVNEAEYGVRAVQLGD